MSAAVPQSSPKPKLSQVQIGLITFGLGILAILAVVLGTSMVKTSATKREANYREAATTNVKAIADAAVAYRVENDGKCPSTSRLRASGALVGLSQDDDPWGRPYDVECVKTAVIVTSKGADEDSTKDDLRTLALYEAPPPPKTREQLLGERLAAQTSVAAVFRMAKPYLGGGLDLDEGKAILLAWATSKLRWPDLQSVPATTFGKAHKDTTAELGKRICASGQVVEIVKTDDRGIERFIGGLYVDGNILRFLTAQSTGNLVQNSYARFCGLVTGSDDYENSVGGVSHAIVSIGMFDLPENRKL